MITTWIAIRWRTPCRRRIGGNSTPRDWSPSRCRGNLNERRGRDAVFTHRTHPSWRPSTLESWRVGLRRVVARVAADWPSLVTGTQTGNLRVGSTTASEFVGVCLLPFVSLLLNSAAHCCYSLPPFSELRVFLCLFCSCSVDPTGLTLDSCRLTLFRWKVWCMKRQLYRLIWDILLCRLNPPP